ncbi:MAG: hypothetical protein WAN11_05140 [Syntrophobacteraceae bacterium]
MTQTEKTGSRKLWLPFILFLAVLVTSCASTGGQEKKSENSLKLSVDIFNGAFRWEDYAEAAAYVPADKKERFWAVTDKLKGKVRITDFNLREVEFKDKSHTANAILQFQFWRFESPTLQTVTFTQKWYFIEKEKQWKVSDSGFGAITNTNVGF